MKDNSEVENKNLTPQPPSRSGKGEKVRIKIRPGRAVTGVITDQDGYALVDEKTAERLYRIGYAMKE